MDYILLKLGFDKTPRDLIPERVPILFRNVCANLSSADLSNHNSGEPSPYGAQAEPELLSAGIRQSEFQKNPASEPAEIDQGEAQISEVGNGSW